MPRRPLDPSWLSGSRRQPGDHPKRDRRIPIDPEGVRQLCDDLSQAMVASTPITTSLRPRPLGQDGDHPPAPKPFVAPALAEAVRNMGGRREPDGQSALPRFSPYAIPTKADPLAVDCPYCVKRPRNLAAHCRAVHPDKPEARR